MSHKFFPQGKLVDDPVVVKTKRVVSTSSFWSDASAVERRSVMCSRPGLGFDLTPVTTFRLQDLLDDE